MPCAITDPSGEFSQRHTPNADLLITLNSVPQLGGYSSRYIHRKDGIVACSARAQAARDFVSGTIDVIACVQNVCEIFGFGSGPTRRYMRGIYSAEWPGYVAPQVVISVSRIRCR